LIWVLLVLVLLELSPLTLAPESAPLVLLVTVFLLLALLVVIAVILVILKMLLGASGTTPMLLKVMLLGFVLEMAVSVVASIGEKLEHKRKQLSEGRNGHKEESKKSRGST